MGFVGTHSMGGDDSRLSMSNFTVGAGIGAEDSRCAPLTPEEIKTKSDDIQDAFAEAREEIEAAMEATGTTYFNEEAEYARECVEKVLGEYYALCDALPEGDRAAFQRANGMKMEQLKAELKQIDHAHDDH